MSKISMLNPKKIWQQVGRGGMKNMVMSIVMLKYWWKYKCNFRNPYENNLLNMAPPEPTYMEPNLKNDYTTHRMTLPRQNQPATYANGTLVRNPPKTYL